MPEKAIVLARISDARGDDERGVTDQLADCLALAQRLGWTVGPAATHQISENDTSAFKRRKTVLPDGRSELRTYRPKFRQALAMLADGRADGLIVYDLDRLARDPRDLEDLIDTVESSRPRTPVESVTGSLRLGGDHDIAMARIMVSLGNKSSRDTSRRVARARLRQATAGQFGGGKRRYGYEPDGVTVRESEAAEIRQAVDAVLAGVSLRQITLSLRERGVPTAAGGRWDTVTLRDLLLRPRNAGLAVHRPSGSGRVGPPYSEDEIVGRAQWEAIISEDQWRAVCAILTDPSRSNNAGNTPRWLGSRIYRCGRCDDGATLVVMGSTNSAKRYARYTCPEAWHLARAAEPLDELVSEALILRLQQDDVADLLADDDGVDLSALYREQASLRELLDEQARLHARKVIDGRQLAAGSRELRAKLDAVDAILSEEAHRSPLAGIAGRSDARQIWDGLDLGRRRALLRVLADVTVMPAKRGRGFDPASVLITFKGKPGSTPR